MTRVLIVDDHDFFRSCLVDLVNASHDLETVGECRDGSEVFDAVAALEPHVVLMDLRMPHVSGLEAAATLQRSGSSARVIMLTTDHTARTQREARARGAAGYLVKGANSTDVLAAVRRVALGHTLWSDDPAAA